MQIVRNFTRIPENCVWNEDSPHQNEAGDLYAKRVSYDEIYHEERDIVC